MRTISPEELKTILENHKHWLYEDCEGWENMRANLRDADLSCANLSYANLRDADLSCADLSCANLSDANLRDADLSCANLRGADLSCANLSYANLRDADLSCANLSYANLSCAKDVSYIPMICPEEGKFIGWKKAEVQGEEDNHYRKVIVKLEIPASAKRSSATTRKCRCDKAKVLEIYNLDGTVAKERKCYSDYNNDFVYKVGKTVEVDDFDEDRWNECSQGIHFFINRQEAIDY